MEICQGDFVNLKDAAAPLGMKYSWLRREAVAGRIPCIRTGGTVGTYKVNVEQVKNALMARAEGGA